MKLINSSTEIISQQAGLLGVYKQIEIAGRVSYKSEDKITNDSAEKFVNMLIERGHLAPLEFGTIYLQIPTNINPAIISFYDENPYSKVNFDDEWYYVTTNARVIVENDIREHLTWMCEPTGMHEKRITARVVCSRGIANEIVRHRTFSYVQESSRYCNYSKSKFNGEVTFIIPSWMSIEEGSYTSPYYSALDDHNHIWKINGEDHITLTFGEELDRKYFTALQAFGDAEFHYFHLLNAEGLTPQLARDVLPLGLKTELVMCGYQDAWDHFLALRCAKDAHPDMQVVANQLKEQLKWD
jgi:thymidylate synthase (FAD)